MIEQQLKSTSQEGHSVRITQALLNFILTLIYTFLCLLLQLHMESTYFSLT